MIKVRRDAVITGNKARDDVVREIRKGRKRWFGEYVSSVKFENIRKELTFKVMIVSMFLSGSVGMLVS
ncbi:MAG: hypothetical protein NZ526_00970 [Aquificaceae bacterium]|nr:hypothetical protein [Aquificaceae bacterium]